MNYENNTFGFDAIIAILGKGEPFFDFTLSRDQQLNENFLEAMTIKEKETHHFLCSFYNISATQQYTNITKICKVRELTQYDEEEFLIKKYEE